MAKPGTKVTSLENPVIGFGGESGGTVQKQYDAFPYSLDFSLSLMDPSRITISFINENRKYDTGALNEDIIEAGTRTWAKQIQYCGGGENTFYGYPMKYSINRSPRGDILTVDYYDASIVELDNCYVLLNGKDFPLVSNPNEAGALPFNNIQENPCYWGIFNLGSEYVRTSSGIPQANPACIDQETLTPEVLYSNHELAERIQENIQVDPDSINILSPQAGGGEPDPDQTFLEGYHGTLRDVLKQWGQRMGFTFYWDPKNPDHGEGGGAGGDRAKQGRLVFLDLKSGLFYQQLKTVSDLMLGKTSGGSANLLDSTESVSREQTFNKAISARYENSGIGDSVVVDKMMILDMLTLPIRGCLTDEGRKWEITKYDRGKKSAPGGPIITGYEEGSPQWRWTNEFRDWYKEWDSANYGPFGPQDEDTQERKWREYQPKRPSQAMGPNAELDETGEEFRDYIRLVKAAAIGRDFFKAYIFFKAMKKNPKALFPPIRTLLDYMQMNPQGTDVNVQVMPCEDALAAVLESGSRVSVGGVEMGGEGNPPPVNIAELCCGKEADNVEKKLVRAKEVIIINPEALIPEDQPGVRFSQDCGLAEENFIVPDLVENKALSKILSTLPSPELGAALNDPGSPNVKLCRKTVVGADCLTVGVLDPCFEATRLLYSQVAGDPKTGCIKNETVSVAVMDSADDVYRINIKQGQAPADENGSPYIFTHVYNYGNSLILDSERHDALYSQLKFVSENAGRFWVASEPVTEREYRRRGYDEDGMSWTNKLIDVNNTSFRGLFQTFDPTAPRSTMPFSEEGPPVYQEFWGEEFSKGEESRQRQLNGFENLEAPEDEPDPCGYEFGNEFSPSTTQTGENTRAPNIEQMIEKIIDKNLNEKTGIPCRQNNTMGMFIELRAATMEITPESLTPILDDNNVLTGYKLKPIYYSPADFFGGAGYGVHPTITVSGKGVVDADLSKKTIIDNTRITQIIFENPDDLVIELDDDGAPDITIVISEPEDGEINFFKHIRFGEGGTSMFDMDSITSTNLSRRQEQRQLACCCTDLEEGIVMHDAGELLILNFNNDTKKQIKRISQATNLTLGSQFSGNLIRDYQRDNKLITMSTNLIPIDKLGANPSNAEDELDWIVDQVKLGKLGADPSYQESGYVMPVTPDNIDNTSGLADCEMDTKNIKYILKGEKFESVVFGMVVNDPEADNVNANGQPVKTVPAGDGDLLEDCTGFIWSDGVNVRQMTIDFENPTTEEIGIEFECGKEWIDLTEEEQQEKLVEIQENLAEYVRKRAYLQDNTSYEASATIADMAFLTKGGAPVDFEGSKGMPAISQGLESLSIKVDGNGIKITASLGTRKKLLGLRETNTNFWKEMNPRTMNQLQINNPGGN